MVVEGGELVVGGGDDDAAGGADSMHPGYGASGVGADGEGVAHGEDQVEFVGIEGAQIDNVGDEESGFLGFGAEVGDFLAGFFDHGGGVVDEGGGEAALEEFEAPLAGASAKVAAMGCC